jgi:hypothetical protein
MTCRYFSTSDTLVSNLRSSLQSKLTIVHFVLTNDVEVSWLRALDDRRVDPFHLHGAKAYSNRAYPVDTFMV